ncbi:protein DETOXIFICATION 35 [Sesamum angolense]|uniref:Protein DETOXIFICATION 35 n=1 Tax=Sesamum angolense TaxID=2727404 RepID=A0AAE1X125_9LAMI|nr:protein DETOXIFICATION 35 [Sesamum angolense]
MEAPLLEQSPRREIQLIGDDGDYLPAGGLKAWWGVFCIESGKLWRIGGPIVIQILCQYGGTSVATIFVGHLGDVDLSAFTIASTVIGTFAFGFMLGMGSALETLCGQCIGPSAHARRYMQRSMIILLATCILLLPIYVFATPILKPGTTKTKIAHLAGY